MLLRPSSKYAIQLAQYKQEFIDAGDSMDGTGPLNDMEDIEQYIQLSHEYEYPENVPSYLVPATQFMFVRKRDDRVVGMIQVRHWFNEYLEQYGGHIGYSVRPSERRKGYAKEMLRMTLPYCQKIGLDRVMISCYDGNIGSEKTIRANGGVYETTVHNPTKDKDVKRFWITL